MSDRKGFILSGIHVITGRRMRRRRKGEWQQTLQRYDKSPTSKFTPLVLVVTVIYFALWGEEKNGGVQCPWGFSCFFGGHLHQTSGFRSPNQYVLQTFGQHKHYLLSVRANSPKSSGRQCR